MTKRVVEGKTTNTRKQIALDFIKGALPEGTLEAVQENLELVGEDYARKKANLKLGDEIFKPVLTSLGWSTMGKLVFVEFFSGAVLWSFVEILWSFCGVC